MPTPESCCAIGSIEITGQVSTHPLRRLYSGLWGLLDSVIEPVFERCFTESRVIVWNQRSLAHLDTEVARVRVSNCFARILLRCQEPSDEFIHMKLFRPSYFNGAIHRRTRCDPAYLTGDIVGRH